MERTATTYVIAERRKGVVTQETYEVVSFARELREDGLPTVILVGKNVEEPANEVAETTGCDVIAVSGEHLALYNTLSHARAVLNVLAAEPSAWVCLPHTSQGFDLAPNLSVALGAACITAVDSTGDGWLGRPVYSGKYREAIVPLTASVVVTVLPGAFKESEESVCSPGRVRIVEDEPEKLPSKTIVVSDSQNRDSSLRDAEVVVSGGRGLGTKDNVDLLRQLAAALPKSAIGASRSACDLGWLNHKHQIGVTGETVSPKLYLACGISGAFQHVSGMRGSQTIVAVNTDPHAAIFQVAHYCIVEDLTTFIPILLEEMKGFGVHRSGDCGKRDGCGEREE